MLCILCTSCLAMAIEFVRIAAFSVFRHLVNLLDLLHEKEESSFAHSGLIKYGLSNPGTSISAVKYVPLYTSC